VGESRYFHFVELTHVSQIARKREAYLVGIDMLLLFFSLLAVHFFLKAEKHPGWFIAAGAACGFGVLTKSVLGLLPILFLLPILPRRLPRNRATVRTLSPLNSASRSRTNSSSFLPTAERFNMMQSIDQWVVTNAIERLAMLTDNGYLASFFINLSGQTLANTRFTTMIKEMIQDHKIRPELVNFEITETCAISNIDAATAFINDLNADSLDTVELVMEFEDEFDMSIPDEEAEKIQTVGAAIDYIINIVENKSQEQ